MTIGVSDGHIGLVVGRGGRNILEISQVLTPPPQHFLLAFCARGIDIIQVHECHSIRCIIILQSKALSSYRLAEPELRYQIEEISCPEPLTGTEVLLVNPFLLWVCKFFMVTVAYLILQESNNYGVTKGDPHR